MISKLMLSMIDPQTVVDLTEKSYINSIEAICKSNSASSAYYIIRQEPFVVETHVVINGISSKMSESDSATSVMFTDEIKDILKSFKMEKVMTGIDVKMKELFKKDFMKNSTVFCYLSQNKPKFVLQKDGNKEEVFLMELLLNEVENLLKNGSLK